MTTADNRTYFTLKAANAQLIGTSQMYQNEASMDLGIESVKTNAPAATVQKPKKKFISPPPLLLVITLNLK
ncbi:MAG: YegP family protein, partial [Saprospiraceae bacterium]